MGRFALIKTRIKSIFNAIRLARIVLKHVEACLSEIFALLARNNHSVTRYCRLGGVIRT